LQRLGVELSVTPEAAVIYEQDAAVGMFGEKSLNFGNDPLNLLSYT
jgi:hypothetical protein